MEILLKRERSRGNATIGLLFVDGKHTCNTLEDVVRADPDPSTPQNEGKVYGETAIPAGRYRVGVTMSQRFQRPLPLLYDVPGFEGIRIHPGNKAVDTHGCILPGMMAANDGQSVSESRVAFGVVFDKINDALQDGQEVWITIEDSA